MNIPDKAVEAAAYALDDYWGGRYAPRVLEELSDEMRAVLEAAAPHIAAQALRDYARSIDDDNLVDSWVIHCAADELDPS